MAPIIKPPQYISVIAAPPGTLERRVQSDPGIAVELLAACKAALPILKAYIHPDQFDGHAARALVMVRDAIEKAEPSETA